MKRIADKCPKEVIALHLSYHVRLKKTIAAHFDNTVYWYRRALDFYIDFCLEKWDLISGIRGIKYQIKFIEEQTIAVNARVLTVPDESNFKQQFPDFPSYLRRVAIKQALHNADFSSDSKISAKDSTIVAATTTCFMELRKFGVKYSKIDAIGKT